MSRIQHITPPGMFQLDGFSHVVVSSGRTAHIAGQGPFDEKMKLVGKDDLYAQTVQAYRNMCRCLAAVGAGPEDVVSSTIYVVDLDDAKAAEFVRAMGEALDGKPFPANASTLVGVTRLGMPGMLVEISAIAAVD